MSITLGKTFVIQGDSCYFRLYYIIIIIIIVAITKMIGYFT